MMDSFTTNYCSKTIQIRYSTSKELRRISRPFGAEKINFSIGHLNEVFDMHRMCWLKDLWAAFCCYYKNVVLENLARVLHWQPIGIVYFPCYTIKVGWSGMLWWKSRLLSGVSVKLFNTDSACPFFLYFIWDS